MFYQKLSQTKIVDLFKTNNFAFLRFFVFHILLLKKIEFFHISYNLTGKRDFHIDFFQVLTCCEISDFGLIKECYEDSL